MSIAVVGGGSWGTAVSWLLGNKGIEVSMWVREPEIAESINTSSRNPVYLKDITLSASVSASSDIKAAVSGVDAIVIATPSIAVRAMAQAMSAYVAADIPVIVLSKGVESGTSMLMTQVLADVLGNPERLAALSGPNHAEEVSRGIPTATVVASHDEVVGRFFQELFMTRTFRVYTNPDVVGVELCAASKNVIAIAAGMSDGLGYGDNTKATLMTRGLAEMARLGATMGANPLTYMGLAGVGDLIATCTSKHSRNRSLGEHVAKGGDVASWEAKTKMVAEGAVSCITVDELARQHGIELPITIQVREVLHAQGSLEDAARSLMGREARDELHGMGLVDD
ncbi:MAG: NAD(P)-dependent glycerol-3-phosphate dehydrogenase [Actinobacteria bacterium]|nr:NAD(P)-dependent glycerol-3-phosphate dehydrogenase [Actinomycetota bacterium]